MIDIHPNARVSPLADIEDSVRGSRIVVGAHSSIDSFVKFKPAGGVGDVLIGRHVAINSGCVFYTGNGITIGDHVAIAANCTFEADVWIGANCVLLDGALLRQGCVVAAGSVVRGELAAYMVYAGSPLRPVGERT